MSTKPRLKTAAAVTACQSREEVEATIAQLGLLQRSLAQAEIAYQQELAELKERHLKACEPAQEKVKQLSVGVQLWCEAHREALTDGGKVKTATLSSGQVSWRLAPPSIRVSNADAVVDYLERSGLDHFIRYQREVDKQALLGQPEACAHIPGISLISGKEAFEIKPWSDDKLQVAGA